MSHTPPENPYGGREPERPRWGQSRPEGDERAQGQPASGGSPYGQNPYAAPSPYGQAPGEQAPYGQPSYGQSGYGQPYGQPDHGQPSPYSQPSSAAPGAGAPRAGYAGGPPPQQFGNALKRPLMLVLAMVTMLAGGVAAVLLSFFTFSQLSRLGPGTVDGEFWRGFEEEVRRSAELEGMTPEEAFDMVMFTLGSMVVVGGFVLLALYTTFAFVGTLTGVGRILATIFLAGSVTLIPFGLANLILVALSAAAIVFLWLPQSNAYFRERKARKLQSRPGGYSPQPYTSQPYTSLPGQQPYGATAPGQSGPGQSGPGQSGHDGSSDPSQR